MSAPMLMNGRFAPRLLLCLCLATSLPMAGPAAAAFIDGQKLLTLCQSNRPAILSYAAGAYEQSRLMSDQLSALREHIFEMPGLEIGHHDDLRKRIDDLRSRIGGYCLPTGVSLAAVGEALCAYVAANRSELAKPGGDVFSAAMNAAWACDPSRKPD